MFLGEMGLAEHQAIYALHRDTHNWHLHLAINRVHPDTEKLVTVNNRFDHEIAHRAIARIEQRQRWEPEAHALYGLDAAGITRAQAAGSGAGNLSAKARDFEERRGERSAERIAIEDAAPIIRRATSWRELHEGLAEKGCGSRRAGRPPPDGKGGHVPRLVAREGRLLSALRSVTAARQAQEKAELRDRQRSSARRRTRARRLPVLRAVARGAGTGTSAEKWRHRQRRPATIEGPTFKAPAPLDIRAVRAVVDGGKVNYYMAGAGRAFLHRSRQDDRHRYETAAAGASWRRCS